MVYARHETLDPVGWEQTAHLLRILYAGRLAEGDAIPPLRDFMPVDPWPDDADRAPEE